MRRMLCVLFLIAAFTLPVAPACQAENWYGSAVIGREMSEIAVLITMLIPHGSMRRSNWAV